MNGNTKLYVSNLPWTACLDDIVALFEEYGNVVDTHFVPNRESTESYTSAGYGFITFENEMDARRALDELSGLIVGGRAMRIDWARPRKPLGYSRRDSAAGE